MSQLCFYSWYLHEKYKREIIRQGVIEASTEKEARNYIIDSMTLTEKKIYVNHNGVITLCKLYIKN